MLKTIAVVTLLVKSLAPVESAYHEHLDYRTVRAGQVSAELADVWGTPDLEGRDYVLMGPASGADTWLRFIAMPPGVRAPAPFRTHGWAATEILVQDPDALARRLAGSPFRVIGPPADLTPDPGAPRAMQVLGPANEVLYLTRIVRGGTAFDLSPAATPVDRVFITVVAGPSLPALRAGYGALGLPLGPDLRWPIGVLAAAHGLPAETLFSLTVAVMPRDYLVELDEYPAGAVPRPQPARSLPGGMAMVSFTVDTLEGTPVRWRRPPRALADFPYRGRRAAVTRGPAGEWIEAIETVIPAPAPPPDPLSAPLRVPGSSP